MSRVQETGRTPRVQGLSWSFAAVLVQLASALLILPPLLRFLSPDQLGLWYAYQLAAGLALLLEFGYQGTFARNFTYVATGASSLRADGIPDLEDGTPRSADPTLMATLLQFMRVKYLEISIGIFVALATIGSVYIYFISRSAWSANVLVSWALHISLTAASFYFGRFNNVLIGLNRMPLILQFQIVSRLCSVGITLMLLWLGLELNAPVLGFGLGALIGSLLAGAALRGIEIYRVSSSSVPRSASDLRGAIWHNARKAGQVAVGTFLVQRATSLFASMFLNLQEFASFALTLQVVQLLMGFARAKFQVAFPTLVGLAGRSRFDEFRRLFFASMTMAWVIFIAGMIFLVAFGQHIVFALGSSITLTSPSATTLIGILYLLEITHGNCAWALTCFNTVPFVRATWITGGAITIGTVVIGTLASPGVIGLVSVQLACQILYNAWKWPLELSRRLRTDSAA